MLRRYAEEWERARGGKGLPPATAGVYAKAAAASAARAAHEQLVAPGKPVDAALFGAFKAYLAAVRRCRLNTSG